MVGRKTNAVVLGFVTKFTRDRYEFGYLGVHKVAVISFSSAMHKAGGLKVSDELSHFLWYPLRTVSGISTLPNAGINPGQAQAFNLHQKKNLESHAIEALG